MISTEEERFSKVMAQHNSAPPEEASFETAVVCTKDPPEPPAGAKKEAVAVAVGFDNGPRLSQPKVFNFIKADKKASNLRWQGLGFSVQTKGNRKVILDNITGSLRPRELTCILGPSGSGKTSMLNILAGRVKQGGKNGAQILGTISVNGRAINPSDHQHMFGYVMQDDALLGTMTPREVLTFSMQLRLAEEARKDLSIIDDMLMSLGLTKCADTMVGNELIKGISGGERKRTAVGAEIITNPAITFLDEPTSGLDTASAFNVISVLKELCEHNQAVLCTIHQPSSEVFDLFAQAIFLSAGQVVYHGPPRGIRAYFDTLGHQCPQNYNPADFVMFFVQTASEAKVQNACKVWSESAAKGTEAPVDDAELPKPVPRRGFWVEFWALSMREALNTARDKATMGARFGSTIFLTLVTGLIFFRIGSADTKESLLVDRESYDMSAHMGAMTMLGIQGMFGVAQPLLLTFTSERPVFLRESAANMYGTIPYFCSKSMVELPLVIVQNLVGWTLGYFLLGLRGNFFLLVGSCVLIGLASASTGLAAGCAVKDAKQAMEVAPALFVPQILFAGFFIKMQLVPVWMRWLQYVCSLKWGMNLLLLIEVKEIPHGESFLEANDIDEDLAGLYVAVLIALTIGFRLLAMLLLSRKAKAFYN